MYINQLIMGIQLCYTITSIRELFLFALFYPFFLFIFCLTSLLLFIPSLCCTRRNSTGRALKNFPSKRPSTGADSLSLFFFFTFRLILIFRNICYTRRRTTSIGWHIKRKQHLDQSRRDNKLCTNSKTHGEEYNVLSCIIGVTLSAQKG